jgi:excisionase family DNA binding protein
MSGTASNDAAPGALEVEAGDQPILFTIEEAARLLRLSRTTLYELMWTDQLVPIRIGRRIRFTRACLEQLIEELSRRRR